MGLEKNQRAEKLIINKATEIVMKLMVEQDRANNAAQKPQPDTGVRLQ